MPCMHERGPGHAQVDFGETLGVIGGVECKIHFYVMSLPHSDAVFVKGYPAETTEAFCDGHVSAFAFFGGIYYPAGDCEVICREGLNPSSTTTPRSPLRGYSGIKRASAHVGLRNYSRITCLMTSLADPRGGTTKATLRAWLDTPVPLPDRRLQSNLPRGATSWCPLSCM